MIFKIKNPDKTSEPVANLSLEKDDDGSVIVLAETKDGYVWHIVGFNTDGTITLMEDVPDDIGFQVDDKENRIIVRND